MFLNGFQTINGIRSALASSHWTTAQLQAHQLRQLKSLLHHAYDNVPFYRRHFNAHAFHPDQFQTLNDTARIPYVNKQHIIQTPPADILSSGIHPDHCLKVSTSGSTGQPLTMHLAQAGQRTQRVAAWRILFEHGFRWTDHTLEIRITLGPTHPVQRLGIAPKTWLSALDPPSTWRRTLEQLRPQVLVACPSVLRTLAAEGPALAHPPRLIFSDTETLYPADRAFIRQRLGADPIDVYGLVELSHFAWECEAHHGFHISADSHLVELIDDELVVTHLDQTDMPVIRYRTGDLAAWSTTACKCGRTLPLLSHLQGRALDSVTLPSGRTLFWTFFHEVLAPFTQLQQWRVIQTAPNAISLQLVTEPQHVAPIESAIRTQLPEPIEIHSTPMQSIPLKPGEKFRAVLRSPNR